MSRATLKCLPKSLPKPQLSRPAPPKWMETRRQIMAAKANPIEPKRRKSRGKYSRGVRGETEATKQLKETVFELHEQGLNTAEIAVRIERTPSRVRSLLAQLRKEGRIEELENTESWSPAEKNRLIELYTAGVSYLDMAKELNRTRSCINNRLTKLRKRKVIRGRKEVRRWITQS